MKYLIAAALAVGLVLAVACGGDDDNATSTATQSGGPTGTASVPTESGSPTASASDSVCTPNPNPATSDQTVVDAPLPGAHVTSPVTISGMIAAFEAQFNISIRNQLGADIVTWPGHSQEGQTLSPFSEDVYFMVDEETPACVWVFDVSEADGITPTQVVQVPVVLEP